MSRGVKRDTIEMLASIETGIRKGLSAKAIAQGQGITLATFQYWAYKNTRVSSLLHSYGGIRLSDQEPWLGEIRAGDRWQEPEMLMADDGATSKYEHFIWDAANGLIELRSYSHVLSNCEPERRVVTEHVLRAHWRRGKPNPCGTLIAKAIRHTVAA